MADESAGDTKIEELTAVVREIQERVRARSSINHVEPAQIPLPDLMPLLHARDAAEGKAESIGTVNPRRPGLLNDAVQVVKKIVGRMLNWHVREQVEFNRAIISSLDAILEALNENNRALSRIASADLGDMRAHWNEWQAGWERKLDESLRAVADLQSGFHHRATLMEMNFRDLSRTHHAEFTAQLEKAAIEIQQRLWRDLDKVRGEFERLIHTELHIIRQRAAIGRAPVPAAPTLPAVPALPGVPIDWLKFAERFRGTEELVKERQTFYLPFFRGCQSVLDIGCGRGEFLKLVRDAGISARGVEVNPELASICREKGLDVVTADLFEYLDSIPNCSLDGILASHVIEHVAPERLPSLIRLAAAKLCTGGVLAIETPNPECLAIFATHFYLDPSHQRPIPPALLVFYLEEHGMGRTELHRLSPAAESIPSLDALPEEFRARFFDFLDYAIISRKL